MKNVLFLLLLGIAQPLFSQRLSNEKDFARHRAEVDSINRLLDNAVVNKQAPVLQKHYAEDFIFTHSTGQVDTKQSWVKFVLGQGAHYLSRRHDSVFVELHKEVALAKGRLTVHRKEKEKTSAYALRYIRVYIYRANRWQLLSHHSTHEWPLPVE